PAGEVVPEEQDAFQAPRRLGVKDVLRLTKAAVDHEVARTQRAPPDLPQESQIVPGHAGILLADCVELRLRDRLKTRGGEDAPDGIKEWGKTLHRSPHWGAGPGSASPVRP